MTKKPKATESYLLKLTPEQRAWFDAQPFNIAHTIQLALAIANKDYPTERRAVGERDDPARNRAKG